ncbi:hypothetical protein MTO96_019134 [Rhipicephalus appendiculatus]
MDSVNAPAPLGPLQQLKQPTASLMASRTDGIATEHRNASSTRPGTRTVPDADAVAASAGSTPSTSTQLTTTSPEDSMEDEDNEPSEWDTVNYRRYTTRRLKGELRSERVTASNAATNISKVEDRLERFEQAQAASTGAWTKFQQQMENFMQQKLDAMQQQITSWMQASQGIREQTAMSSPPPVKPKKSDGPPVPKKSAPPAAEHIATQPRIENQHEQQKTPRTLERESAVMTDRALDTIIQLLEKLNSRMEAIERAMAQQEQVIMQHKEVNEREIAQIKATADECKRNYRRARNRSRE